jgi:biotin transport system substrate-specific component
LALYVLLGTVAIVIGARLAVPLGSTPSTLQSLAVLLGAGIAGPWVGLGAVLLYAACAFAGLPVLSFGSAIPFPGLAGSASLGWIAGFVPAALLAGFAQRWAGARLLRWLAVALAAHAVMIAVGMVWNRAGVEPVLLAGALLKSLIAAALLALLRERLEW